MGMCVPSLQVDKSEAPPLLLSGHDKEVTAVDWCPTSIEKVSPGTGHDCI